MNCLLWKQSISYDKMLYLWRCLPMQCNYSIQLRNLVSLCFTLFIFAAISLFFTCNAVSAATIVTPSELETGRITMIVVHAPELDTPPIVRFAGKTFQSFDAGAEGAYNALITIPLDTKSGERPLQLLCGKNKAICASKKTYVKHLNYPEEHLQVARKMVEFKPGTLKRVLADQKAVRDACATITPSRYWVSPFIWPVESKILSPFGLRRFFNGKPRSPHSGTDMRAATGTPIKASNRGRVVLARNCYLSGNTMILNHGAGLFTLYAHLSKFNAQKDDMVGRGDIIGWAGTTGRATGPHLHWGVSLAGIRVDPESLMEVAGTPRKIEKQQDR